MKYEKPNVTIFEIQTQDIIVTSLTLGSGDGVYVDPNKFGQ